MRGAGDWRDLWEYAERIRRRPGSALNAAVLQDPDVVEELAALRDDDYSLPIEGFSPVLARLASLEDRLTQLLYVAAKAPTGSAPTAPRPTYPHHERREELRRRRMTRLELQLIPGGDDD